MPSGTRSLAFLFVVSALLFFAIVPRFELLDDRAVAPPSRRNVFKARGILDPGDGGGLGGDTTSAAASASSPAADTSATPASTPTSTSTSTTPTSTSTSTSTSTTPTSTSTPPTSTSTPPTPTSTPGAAPSTPANGGSSTAAPVTTPPTGGSSVASAGPSVSTAPTGTDTVTVPGASTASSATPSASSTDTSNNSSGGLSVGSIVGMSVAGGVAVIGIVGFMVWKFTRKRFTDFDDNEAIKWPELNAHGGAEHAVPTTATGRAGFGEDDDPLTRAQSNRLSAYASSLATSSTPEFYQGTGGPDPYAVPPLPHLNPNQAYHDDPNYIGHDPNQFYDPYRGPVPDTAAFDTASGLDSPHPAQVGYGGEVIPMTQMARNRSMAYSDAGRASPAPGRQSPGPSIAMGRQSPGPQMAYGGPMDAGRASPGPQMAYGAAGGYDGYGARQ